MFLVSARHRWRMSDRSAATKHQAEGEMTAGEITSDSLRAFFERFQSLSAASDVETLAAMYAGNVMIAGPKGAQIVSSADLQRVIPKRRQLLESVGCQHTALVGFDETMLTDRY